MDLLPLDGEAVRDYHFRVARALGVQLDNQGVREFELENAVSDLAPDLVLLKDHLLNRMRKMWWGKGYTSELQTLYGMCDADVGTSEKATRIDLVKNNFQRLSLLATVATEDWDAVVKRILRERCRGSVDRSSNPTSLSRFRLMSSASNEPALGYFRVPPGEEPKALRNEDLMSRPWAVL